MKTMGQKSECQKYTAEICGSETVSSTYSGSTDFLTFDLTPGTKATPLGPDVDTFWNVDSSYCNVLSYDAVMNDGSGGYVASTHLTIGGASGK